MLRRCLHVGYLITLFVIPYASATADPYKWSDSQGRVHYGDRPPPDQAAEPVKVHPSPTPKSAVKPTAHTGANPAEPATGTSRQDETTSPNGETSSKQLMQENCQIAQRNFEILTTSGRRVHATDADGKPYVLDDKERELKLSETQKEIEKFCP
ncbi:MAG: DUF4124 domain-containing protein [Gammaproteobacteria bacterium]